MKKAERALVPLLAALTALSCAGCAPAGADGLYALPRMSDEYVQLETLISQRIEDGGEYAAPTGGSNRQSVQLHDLDGDGTEEAVAFLADSDHTPTVCVYRRGSGEEYFLDTVIYGEGSAVGSVEYADVSGDGIQELILTWQIGGDMRLLSVYSLAGEEPAALLNADCSEFLLSDLDGDGTEELIDLVLEPGGGSSLVRYTFGEDGGASSSSALLSEGITEILRARTGYLSDGGTALFVESGWEDELITDVFTVSADAVRNITMASSGRSGTLRTREAYAEDINGDRVMELPEASGDILNWYSLDASGRKTLAMTTYHDFANGWYLALPELMLSELTVETEDSVSGETAAVFTVADGSGRQTLLAIYTLTGENRLDRAGEEGRFVLAEGETTVYAAELFTDALTEEEITDSFNLIAYTEWQTGVS